MTWTMPRESRELVGPINVTANGVAVVGFEVALIPSDVRPAETDWGPPDVVQGQRWVLVGPGTPRALGPGYYWLWVRYTANPESPVLAYVGHIRVD